MSVRVAVCYGQPTDTEAFDEYYRRVHIRLASRVPGLREFTWGGKVTSMDGTAPALLRHRQSVFRRRRRASGRTRVPPEMAAAGKDVRNFATEPVSMFIHTEETVGP